MKLFGVFKGSRSRTACNVTLLIPINDSGDRDFNYTLNTTHHLDNIFEITLSPSWWIKNELLTKPCFSHGLSCVFLGLHEFSSHQDWGCQDKVMSLPKSATTFSTFSPLMVVLLLYAIFYLYMYKNAKKLAKSPWSISLFISNFYILCQQEMSFALEKTSCKDNIIKVLFFMSSLGSVLTSMSATLINMTRNFPRPSCISIVNTASNPLMSTALVAFLTQVMAKSITTITILVITMALLPTKPAASSHLGCNTNHSCINFYPSNGVPVDSICNSCRHFTPTNLKNGMLASTTTSNNCNQPWCNV